MTLFRDIADTSGVPRSQVQIVYDALLKVVRDAIESDCKVRLPGIGIISLKFRAAKPKRKGINPFTKEEQWFKAKPAMNKLKFRPAKNFRRFVEKLPVVAPKKKGKKAKK